MKKVVGPGDRVGSGHVLSYSTRSILHLVTLPGYVARWKGRGFAFAKPGRNATI
jgi:hypothetical protein